MKKTLAILALTLAACSRAFADTPPALPIPHVAGKRSLKSIVVPLARYPRYLDPGKREYQQGGDYDTSDYCSAAIYASGDAGIAAAVDILDIVSPVQEAIQDPASFSFSGHEQPDKRGKVKSIALIPVLTNHTAIIIKLSKSSAAQRKDFFVDMVAFPCSFTPPAEYGRNWTP